MHRFAASFASAAALVVALGGCGGGGPDELVIAQIVYATSGSSAPPPPSDVFRFSLALDGDLAGTHVFEGVGVAPADQGRTFTIEPTDDPQFAALAAILTNGVDDTLALKDQNAGGGGGAAIRPESVALVGLDPGFTGPDLTGFTLTRIRLVVDQLSTTPAGGQTNFQFSVRFVFIGTRP
jgi:hypothetical protein